MSRTRNIQSIVGYGLPYVFVENIKLTKGFMKRDDRNYYENTGLSYIKNKFGRNEKQKKSNSQNKNYYTDEVITATLSLSIPELFAGRRWFGKNSTKEMSVCVVQSTHPDATKILMGGDRYVEESLPDHLKPFVLQRKLNIPAQINLSSYKTKEIAALQDTLCLVPLDVSFVVNSKHLTYFLYSEVGSLVGSRTIERVMDNDIIKRTATSFYLPNGSVWSGPVHKHNDVWMVGARHTSRAHPVLEKVEYNNVKIQDFRIFNRLEEMQNNISLTREVDPRRILSNLFLTRDGDSAARGLFAVNIESFLRENSRFNNLFYTSKVDKLMAHASIQSLRVIRIKREKKGVNDFDFIDQKDLYSTVAESGDHSSRKFLMRKNNFIDENMDGISEKYVGTIAEKKLPGLKRKRVFSFIDSQISTFESGEYGYGVELTVVDPTAKFLELQIKGLKKARKLLSDYYEVASNRRYYNYRGQIDMQSIAFLGKVYGSKDKLHNSKSFEFFPWRRATKIYLKVLQNLVGGRTSSNAKSLYALLGPSSGGVEGVEAFLKLLDGLIQKLLSYGVQTERPYSDKRSAAKYNKKSSVTLLEMAHHFDNTVNAGIVKDFGVDYYGGYLTKNYTGPMSILRENVIRRFSKEADRLGIKVPESTNLVEYKKFYSTLTPIRVTTNTDNYDLMNLPSVQPEILRRMRIQIIKMRNRADNQGVKTPDNGGATYDMIRSILRQQGSGAVLENYSISLGSPHDPEVESPPRGEERQNVDSSKFLPGGTQDNLSTKNSNRVSDNKQQLDNREKGVPEETMADLIIEQGDADILEPGNIRIKYVTGFSDDMDVQYVDAPHGASSQIIIIESKESQSQEDAINTVVVLENTGNKEAETQEPSKDEQELGAEEGAGIVEVEEPKEEEFQEEPDPSTDSDDNADASPDIVMSTGSEEVAGATTGATRAIERATPTQAPPTAVRSEQQQTYLVGRTTNEGSGGGTGGY